MNEKDNDSRKVVTIYQDFAANMISNITQFIHWMMLIFMRGLNVSVMTHFVIAKTAFMSIHKTIGDISKFQLFRKFLINLDKEFPLIRFTLVNNDN